MVLGRNEEMIFREVQALAGDLGQIADNLTRNHEERLREAEESKRQVEEEARVAMPVMVMRPLDQPGLLKDLDFIKARLTTLMEYMRTIEI